MKNKTTKKTKIKEDTNENIYRNCNWYCIRKII